MLHRCRCEVEHFTKQADRSAAPPGQAFSHVSVNTAGTEITDMCAVLNYLGRTSDRGLVFIRYVGPHAEMSLDPFKYRLLKYS